MKKLFSDQLNEFKINWEAWRYSSEDLSSNLYTLIETAQKLETDQMIKQAISLVLFTATNIAKQETKYVNHVSMVLKDTLMFMSSSNENNENVSLKLDLKSVISAYKDKVDALLPSTNTWSPWNEEEENEEENEEDEEEENKLNTQHTNQPNTPQMQRTFTSWPTNWLTNWLTLPPPWWYRQSLIKNGSAVSYKILSLEEKIVARQQVLSLIEDVYRWSKKKTSTVDIDTLYDRCNAQYWSIDKASFLAILKDLQDDSIVKIDTQQPRININGWLLDFKKKWYQAWAACAEALKSESYQEKREEKIEQYKQQKREADDALPTPTVSVHAARNSALSWYFLRGKQYAESLLWVDAVSKQLKSYKAAPLMDRDIVSFNHPDRPTNQLFDYNDAYNPNQLRFLASQLIKDLSVVWSVNTDLLWSSNTRHLKELLEAVKNDWIVGICSTEHLAQLKLLRPFIHVTSYNVLIKTRKQMLTEAEKKMMSILHEKKEMTQRIRAYLKEKLFASGQYNNDDLSSKLADDHAADIYEYIRTWTWFFAKKPTIEETIHHMLHHLDLDDTKKHKSTYNLSYQDFNPDERLGIAMEHVFNAHKKELCNKQSIFSPSRWHEQSEFGAYMHHIAQKREKDRSSSTERKRWSVFKDVNNYEFKAKNARWESMTCTFNISNKHDNDGQLTVRINNTSSSESKTINAWSTEELLANIYALTDLDAWFKISLAYFFLNSLKKQLLNLQWVTDCSWGNTEDWYNDKKRRDLSQW
jgi:hypothetical protein